MKSRIFSFCILFLFSLFTVAQPTSAAPKVCDGVKTAQVANFARQIFALKNLREIENTKYKKAELDYRDWVALGNPSRAQLAMIDIQSAQGNVNKYNAQIDQIDQKRQAILKTCRLPSEGDKELSSKSKLKKCSTSTINALNSLSSQYRTKQSLKKLNYEYMQKSEILIVQYQSLGQFANASKEQIDYSKYLSSYQTEEVFATLIKQEFEALQSTCSGSRITLPSVFTPPAKSNNTTNTNSESLSECRDASCMFKSWNVGNLGILGTNGSPSRSEKSRSSNIRTYCQFKGAGSIQVKNPRIFMSFTSTNAWNQAYPYSAPKEQDFLGKDAFEGISTTALESIDLQQVNNFYWSDAQKRAESKILFGKTIAKVTNHVCSASFPWQGDARKQFGSNIKGVGFFYVSELSNGQMLLVYLGGYHADWAEEPVLKVNDISVEGNLLKINGTLTGLAKQRGYYNHILPTDWPQNGYPTSVTFAPINLVKFEKFVDDTLVCYSVNRQKKVCTDRLDPFVTVNGYPAALPPTLDISTLGSGVHTIDISAELADGSIFSSITRSFTISK